MWLTLGSFVFFTALVGVCTWLIVRKDEVSSEEGFFLAGRGLTWPFIAGSLLLTNLSTEQMVGLNASAFTQGLSVMAWEVVAVVALVFMALFFLPRFLRGGVATVPEYLEQRFDHRTGVITNLIFLAAYAVILLPIILYTGARGLNSMLHIDQLLGVSESVSLWVVVWIVGLIGSIYALFGGLRTVAVSDTLNGIGLLTGGLLIVYLGLSSIGGGSMFTGIEVISEAMPERLNSIGGTTQEVPFSTLLTGVLFINVFYWCTNQQIIQRTFGASSLAEGQKGVLLTGVLKLLGPLYLVLPGIIAYYMVTQGIIDVGIRPGTLDVPNADNAYGRLVSYVLPSPLTGFFAAVMVGAILSSFNSALNSTCTLFSLGLYKGVMMPKAADREVVRSGQYFGWFIALVAMFVAPMLAKTTSIFAYLQEMNAIYFIPILAVVIVGMLTRRVPGEAANWALLFGVAAILIGYFVPPISTVVSLMNRYHFLALVLLYLILFMLVYGAVKPRKTEYVPYDAKVVDMTPWKHTSTVGVVLLLIVAGVYIFFADFSVLTK